MVHPTGLHPILAAASKIEAAVKSVATVNPTFMSTAEKSAALVELTRVQAEVAELRLRVLAASDDVAAETAARDAGEWLAHATRSRFEDARADHRLAVALDRRYPMVATGLREGEVNLAQAHVIAHALDELPGDTPTEWVQRAEATLVDHAARFGPRQLARVGRRILHVMAPDFADAAEARRLEAMEAAAHRRTRLTLRRLGDGTTRLTGLLPDHTATRLATYLEAFTNPGRATTDSVAPDTGDPAVRLPYPRRLGEAFGQLLETIDPTRLPLHAGDATTVVVTLSLEQLRADLATAEIIGASHLPGADHAPTITAHQARRLACTAGIIPAVLGGDSQPLDLGRTRRLFSPAQRKALLLRDRHCRADGCTVPGTWCEAHHRNPWQHDGPTDLDNGVLLCSHHHTRAHDPAYRTERTPTGHIRYHRRR